LVVSVRGRTVVPMAQTLTLPVPGTLTARLIVLDPRRPAPEGISRGGRVEEIKAGHPALPQPALLARGGAPAEVLDRMGRAERHLLVEASGPAGWPPRHLFEAMTSGGALAHLTGGVLIDPLTARVVAPESIDHAPGGPGAFLPQHYVRVSAATHADGLRMSTTGLSRLGLPEVRTLGLPPYLGQAWARLTNSLAYHLVQDLWADLEETLGLTSREVPDELAVTPDDVAMAESENPLTAYEARVRLWPGNSHLTLVPPRGFAGSESQWRSEAVIMLFPAARI
jgi:hypothetical protein